MMEDPLWLPALPPLRPTPRIRQQYQIPACLWGVARVISSLWTATEHQGDGVCRPASVGAQRGGDVRVPGAAEQGQDQIADGGHDLWRSAGANLELTRCRGSGTDLILLAKSGGWS